MIPFADNRGQWMNNYAVKHTGRQIRGKANAGGTIGPVPTLFYGGMTERPPPRHHLRSPTAGTAASRGGGNQKWWRRQGTTLQVDEQRDRSGNGCGIKPIVMRYADVLLMAAEAANELNDLPYAKAATSAKSAYRAFKSTMRSTPILTASFPKGLICSGPSTRSACSNSTAGRSASRTSSL